MRGASSVSAGVVRAGDRGGAAGADSPGPSPSGRSLTQNRPDRQARSRELGGFLGDSWKRRIGIDQSDRLLPSDLFESAIPHRDSPARLDFPRSVRHFLHEIREVIDSYR